MYMYMYILSHVLIRNHGNYMNINNCTDILLFVYQ